MRLCLLLLVLLFTGCVVDSSDDDDYFVRVECGGEIIADNAHRAFPAASSNGWIIIYMEDTDKAGMVYKPKMFDSCKISKIRK